MTAPLAPRDTSVSDAAINKLVVREQYVWLEKWFTASDLLRAGKGNTAAATLDEIPRVELVQILSQFVAEKHLESVPNNYTRDLSMFLFSDYAGWQPEDDTATINLQVRNAQGQAIDTLDDFLKVRSSVCSLASLSKIATARTRLHAFLILRQQQVDKSSAVCEPTPHCLDAEALGIKAPKDVSGAYEVVKAGCKLINETTENQKAYHRNKYAFVGGAKPSKTDQGLKGDSLDSVLFGLEDTLC